MNSIQFANGSTNGETATDVNPPPSLCIGRPQFSVSAPDSAGTMAAFLQFHQQQDAAIDNSNLALASETMARSDDRLLFPDPVVRSSDFFARFT